MSKTAVTLSNAPKPAGPYSHGVDVVKVTAHLEDLADFGAYNVAYAEFFTEPYPVRTTVGSRLANFLVEIDVVAAIPQG
jgi:2-iminobutanoate/2-iminopropanoate deaminase